MFFDKRTDKKKKEKRKKNKFPTVGVEPRTLIFSLEGERLNKNTKL